MGQHGVEGVSPPRVYSGSSSWQRGLPSQGPLQSLFLSLSLPLPCLSLLSRPSSCLPFPFHPSFFQPPTLVSLCSWFWGLVGYGPLDLPLPLLLSPPLYVCDRTRVKFFLFIVLCFRLTGSRSAATISFPVPPLLRACTRTSLSLPLSSFCSFPSSEVRPNSAEY